MQARFGPADTIDEPVGITVPVEIDLTDTVGAEGSIEIDLTDTAAPEASIEIDLTDRTVYDSEITLESGDTLESGVVGPCPELSPASDRQRHD